MDENLIGYLLNALDADERSATEAYLAANGDARRKLDLIRTALAPLELDRAAPDPPARLTERTLERVARGTALPQPASSGNDVPFSPARWKRIDVAVAFGILIVAGGLGTSGLARVRDHQERARCQNNMRELHQSLISYAHTHSGAVPAISDQPPYNYAGAYIPILEDARQLNPKVIRDCPSLRPGETPVYSYPLGYRDESGNLHGLRFGPIDADPEGTPILADRPTARLHGRGFNVLSLGGSVNHCLRPTIGIGGDHIFENDDHQVKAGKHRRDSVLANDGARP